MDKGSSRRVHTKSCCPGNGGKLVFDFFRMGQTFLPRYTHTVQCLPLPRAQLQEITASPFSIPLSRRRVRSPNICFKKTILSGIAIVALLSWTKIKALAVISYTCALGKAGHCPRHNVSVVPGTPFKHLFFRPILRREAPKKSPMPGQKARGNVLKGFFFFKLTAIPTT